MDNSGSTSFVSVQNQMHLKTKLLDTNNVHIIWKFQSKASTWLHLVAIWLPHSRNSGFEDIKQQLIIVSWKPVWQPA